MVVQIPVRALNYNDRI